MSVLPKPLLRWATPLLAALVSTVNSRTPVDNHYFAAGTVGWHLRDGFIDFDHHRIEHVKRRVLRSQGVSLGRNFGLPFGLRLGVPLRFDYGKVTEDTVDDITLTDGTNPPLALNSLMYHAGIEPLLHVPFRMAPNRAWAYGAIGGGIHYVTLVEEVRIIEDRRRVEGIPWLEESKRVSFGAAAGAGLEITVNPWMSFFSQYAFRFWKPVKRTTQRDLFPLDAKPYAERFYTHDITVGILFSQER
ncbi:MAG: hypothetical protein JXA18_06460 [Chitinispirillaceae bacterium]|nr:hypothetical protein [Chitinispirillaceae bacterium]